MPKDKGKDKGNEKEKEKDKKKGGMFNRSKTKTKSFDVPPLPNKPDINTQSSQQSQWAWSVEPPAATGGNQDYDKLTPQDREEMLKIRRAKDQGLSSSSQRPEHLVDYNKEPECITPIQKPKQFTQPLTPPTTQHSDVLLQSLPSNVEEELSKLEIERDHYKRESEGKEQTIQQYQQELIQCKTRLRQYTSSQQKQSLEDETAQLKVKESELKHYDQYLQKKLDDKEAELKQKHDQDLQKKLDDNEAELKQKHNQDLHRKLEDKVAELKQKHDQDLQKKLEDNEAELKQKHDWDLHKKLEDKVAELKQKHDWDLQKKLEDKEAELKQKHDQDLQKKLEDKKAELKQKYDQDLQKKLEDKEAELKQKTFRIKFIQDELFKKDETILEKDNELKNKKVQERIYLQKIQDLSKETATHAAIGIENERKEVNKKLQKLETEEISKLKEEIKTLEEKLKEQSEIIQGNVEDGASANSSLTDEDKGKIAVELVKEKEQEIKDLQEKLSKLENNTDVSDHTTILAQLEEITKEKQELEREKEEFERLAVPYRNLFAENKELKQKLLHIEMSQDIHEGQEKHLHLHAHIAKLKIKEQQQTEELVKKNELIEELNKDMQKLNTENQRLYLNAKPKTVSSPEHSDSDITKMKIEITSASIEIEQLNKQIKQIQQEAHTEKERMLTDINNQSNEIKQYQRELKKLKGVEQDYNKLAGEMSHKEIELQDMCDLLEEKGKTIQTLMESAVEKSKSVDYSLHGEVAKLVQQLNDATEAVNSKQIKIAQLQENMEVQEFQMKAFKEDFERERADREGMSSKITTLEGQILTLQQSLNDERHEKETLLHEKESVKAKMEIESLQREEQVAEWEEEKLVFTSQVNGYSRQCDELKKTLLQIQNKCKSLEDQLRHKTGLDTEINRLKSKLHLQNELETEINQLKIQLQQKENEMKAQIHQKDSEINSLNVKCSETEKNFRKTESFVTQLQQELQSEYVDKQHLLSVFRQEQAKVENLENEMIKMRNANKILMEKVSSQKISAGHNISQRRNYPSTSEGYPVQPAMAATNSTNADIVVTQGQVHGYKEQLSGSYDLPPPQMNREQMREFGRRYDNQQREQQEERWRRQQTLQQMEQQRQIEQARADKALEELEQLRLEQKRMEASKPQYQSNETRNDELVSGTSKPVTSEPDTSDDIPENPLLEGIDQDIQYYAKEAREMTRPPNDTKELDVQESLPYDPNLVCPKCGKQYHIGQIQRFKRHVEERCPNRSSCNIMSPSQNCSNEQIFSGASDIIPENPLLDSDIHYHAEKVRNMVRPPSDSSDEDSSDNNMPYDTNLVCPKCGKRFRIGGIQRFKRHVEKCCPNRN